MGGGAAGDSHASAARERLVINAYGDTSLTVSGVRVSAPVLLFPHFPTYWEVPSLAAALSPDALTLVKVLRPRPAVLLLGLPVQVPPPPDLRAWAADLGVGLEVMGVGEACHTFNLLNGDGMGVALGCVTRGALRGGGGGRRGRGGGYVVTDGMW